MLLSQFALAAQLHPFTGTVTRVTRDSIELRVRDETLQFGREELGKSKSSEPKVGDRVTIWSRLKAERVQKRREEAGESGRESDPIIDDRAFYGASADPPDSNDEPPAGT